MNNSIIDLFDSIPVETKPFFTSDDESYFEALFSDYLIIKKQHQIFFDAFKNMESSDNLTYSEKNEWPKKFLFDVNSSIETLNTLTNATNIAFVSKITSYLNDKYFLSISYEDVSERIKKKFDSDNLLEILTKDIILQLNTNHPDILQFSKFNFISKVKNEYFFREKAHNPFKATLKNQTVSLLYFSPYDSWSWSSNRFQEYNGDIDLLMRLLSFYENGIYTPLPIFKNYIPFNHDLDFKQKFYFPQSKKFSHIKFFQNKRLDIVLRNKELATDFFKLYTR